LSRNAMDFGIRLSPHQLSLLDTFMAELLDWNQGINLIGLSDRNRIINELLLDSLVPLTFIPEIGRLLDVGSGAGFPGIVVKICRPRLRTVLLEANHKKTGFLKQVARLLELNDIEVINGRIERNGFKLHPDGYNIVTARGLAPLERVIGWCSPFLCSEGTMIGFLGNKAETSLKESREAMEDNSLMVDRLIPYSLPGMRSGRTLAVFKKRPPPPL
jgi:16S rRNA (guanine527-N7)-methyltransferase